MPFLSLLDDRAKPKGSRDPLGFESIWMRLGRQLVGNLTTITSSIDNFAVAVLGFYWAHNCVLSKTELPSDVHREVREYFLKFEQLAAYLRESSQADVLGITRVKERLAQGGDITLGLQMHEQILSNQASYGLWGLYSSASRQSGLLSGNDRTPTDFGANIARLIDNELGDLSGVLRHRIEFSQAITREELEAWRPRFIRAISSSKIRGMLFERLIAGPEDHPNQRALWQSIQRWPDLRNADVEFPRLLAYLANNSEHITVSQLALGILDTERILVLANQVFTLARQNTNTSIGEFLESIDSRVDASALPAQLPSQLPESQRAQLLPFFLAAKQRDWQAALSALIALNTSVMKARDGAPWILIEGNQKLNVRVRAETSRVHSAEELSTAWDYDYFLKSLLQIIRQSPEEAYG